MTLNWHGIEFVSFNPLAISPKLNGYIAKLKERIFLDRSATKDRPPLLFSP